MPHGDLQDVLDSYRARQAALESKVVVGLEWERQGKRYRVSQIWKNMSEGVVYQIWIESRNEWLDYGRESLSPSHESPASSTDFGHNPNPK